MNRRPPAPPAARRPAWITAFDALRATWRDVGRDTRWVLVSYFLWGIGEGLWMFIQPLYMESLGATPQQSGSAIGMWGLGRLLVILPVGVLADRFGARRLMLPGWFLGLTGVLVLALAPGWQVAAVGFLIYGFSATAIPLTNVYLMQAARHDPTRRPDVPLPTVLTLLWAAYSLGIVVTPGIGGWIGDQVGLRAVFGLSCGWFMLSTLAIWRTTRYPRPQRPAHGYDYRGLLRRRPVVWSYALVTLAFVAVMTGFTLSAQYLEDVHGYSRTAIGALGSVNALGTAITSMLLGRLAAGRGFAVALWIVAAALVLLLSSGAWPVVALGYFALGAYYTTRPLAASVIGELVGEHQRGLAFALVDTLAGLATLIGTNLSGALYEGAPGWPFIAGAAGCAGVVLLGALLRTDTARPARASDAVSGVESASR